MFGYGYDSFAEMWDGMIKGDPLLEFSVSVLLLLLILLIQALIENFVLKGISRIMMLLDMKKRRAEASSEIKVLDEKEKEKEKEDFVKEANQLHSNLIVFLRKAEFFPIFCVTMPVAAFLYKGLWQLWPRIKRAFRLYVEEMFSYI